ncbi:AMP-binding protein [Selenomonas ruminantium]|uniref:Amino acid adenylation domain-containing protein n=1 Tax=Selenomonas ruminantium TaxID=971 RepID=A0A1I0X5S3_SELRU|nr:AMP-binding protein [Selenomonas ruminantium]SFA95698.1 amino acid adenylation domain-containing protein [Selenomonas ruminantium]
MENMVTDKSASISLRDNDEAYVAAKAYYGNLLAGMDKEMLPLNDVEGKAESRAQLLGRSDVDAQAIKAFCAKYDFTEKAFFHACFAYVLTKFTGRDEAFYATVYDGRNGSGSARAVTLPEKMFPVLLTVEDTESIVDFVCKMGQQLNDSMAYAVFSFADIAQEYDLTAELVFAYRGEDAEENSGGKKGEDAVRLHIEGYIRDGKVAFGCEYRSDCYSEELIGSILDSLGEAAKEFLVKERLADVSLLSKEMEAKLDRFNETEVPYDKSQTVVSLFRKAAQAYADRRAVIFADQEYCYAEVDALSEKIAACLAAKGLGRGDVVSVFIPRSAYMPIAALGVLKAGCAYQPLDPTYPEERLNFMVQDAAAKLLITTKELRPIMTAYQGEVLLVEDIPSLPQQKVPSECEPVPQDTFILLYTSGSTGVPKGVKLTHGNLVCFINWYQRFYSLTAEACVGSYASFGFDANMMDIYPALTCGAAVYIVTEEMRFDLAGMNACFAKHKVTHAFMTTQVARQFAQEMENSSLKCLSAGGEKLATLEPPRNYAFYNGYGPTENTIFTTIYKVERAENNIPIGKPLDNVKLYIVDRNGKRLPPGACGELWAAGPQVGGRLPQPTG